MSFEEYLLKEIDERISRLTDRIAGGGCEDHSQYMKEVGRVKSFREIRLLVTEYLERSEREE